MQLHRRIIRHRQAVFPDRRSLHPQRILRSRHLRGLRMRSAFRRPPRDREPLVLQQAQQGFDGQRPDLRYRRRVQGRHQGGLHRRLPGPVPGARPDDRDQQRAGSVRLRDLAPGRACRRHARHLQPEPHGRPLHIRRPPLLLRRRTGALDPPSADRHPHAYRIRRGIRHSCRRQHGRSGPAIPADRPLLRARDGHWPETFGAIRRQVHGALRRAQRMVRDSRAIEPMQSRWGDQRCRNPRARRALHRRHRLLHDPEAGLQRPRLLRSLGQRPGTRRNAHRMALHRTAHLPRPAHEHLFRRRAIPLPDEPFVHAGGAVESQHRGKPHQSPSVRRLRLQRPERRPLGQRLPDPRAERIRAERDGAGRPLRQLYLVLPHRLRLLVQRIREMRAAVSR